MEENHLIIKIGGGLIAPKQGKFRTAKLRLIRRLAKEIKSTIRRKRVIIVVGSGNFGHHAVQRYGIKEKIGVAKVQLVAQEIGRIVVSELVKLGLPAILISPHSMHFPSIVNFFKLNYVPVLYGDVVLKNKKAIIYSGEIVISQLVEEFSRLGIKFKKVIQVGQEDGVLDPQGRVIRKIDSKNFERIKKAIRKPHDSDVTGGMLHKVSESLALGRNFGLETSIINGRIKGRLAEAIEGKSVPGTLVCNL